MPQIEGEEVPNPDLDAQIMAERLAYSLDRGRHYRRAVNHILRKVMDAGARGCEVIISRKMTSQRPSTSIFRAGTMSESGQLAQVGIDKGVAQCIQKSGVLVINVKIMRADTKMGDIVINL
jgi:small subunit ribosomal protein S3